MTKPPLKHPDPDEALDSRRRRGTPKSSHPLPEMQHMMDAADECGMDCESATMDRDMESGEPTLRMSFRKRKGKKAK